MAKYSVSDINFFELRFTVSGMQKHGAEVVTVETDLVGKVWGIK